MLFELSGCYCACWRNHAARLAHVAGGMIGGLSGGTGEAEEEEEEEEEEKEEEE